MRLLNGFYGLQLGWNRRNLLFRCSFFSCWSQFFVLLLGQKNGRSPPATLEEIFKRGQEQTILFAWKNEWGNNGKGFIRRRSRMSNRPGRHGGGRPLQRRRDSNDVSTTTFHLGRNHENFYLKSLESIGF